MYAWCRYTRGRFERTHGDVLSGHTEKGGNHRQFCLPKFAHVELSRASEAHRRNFWIFPIFKFENRSRTSCHRFLQSFALPDKACAGNTRTSKRHRVCRQHAHMLYSMWTWCRYTRGRFEPSQGSLPLCISISIPLSFSRPFSLSQFYKYLSLFSRFRSLAVPSRSLAGHSRVFPGRLPFFLGNNAHSEKALYFLSFSFIFLHFLSFSFSFVHFLSFSFIFFHFLSCSVIFFRFLSFSFIFFQFRSFSFSFFHVLSFSSIFVYCLSFSFIFFHVLSCSFMFFHFLSFSLIFFHFFIFFHFLSFFMFSFLGCSKSPFFCLDCLTISY